MPLERKDYVYFCLALILAPGTTAATPPSDRAAPANNTHVGRPVPLAFTQAGKSFQNSADFCDRRFRVYRGLPKYRVLSNEDILGYFQRPSRDLTARLFALTPQRFQSNWMFRWHNKLCERPHAMKKWVNNHSKASYFRWPSPFVSFSHKRSVAANFKGGHTLGFRKRRGIRSTVEFEVYPRTVGVVFPRGDFSDLGFSAEDELLFWGGVDPASVARVIVEDIETQKGDLDAYGTRLRPPKILRRRVFERTADGVREVR